MSEFEIEIAAGDQESRNIRNGIDEATNHDGGPWEFGQSEGLRAFAGLLREWYPADVFPSLTDADHRSVNDALAGRAERTHVSRDRVSADMMRRAAQLAERTADEWDEAVSKALVWAKNCADANDRADRAEAVIAEALGVTQSSSVPLGVPEARHYDRLLAEARRILSGYESEGDDR